MQFSRFSSDYFQLGFLTKYFNWKSLLDYLRRFKMPRAFVLINVESGSEDDVLKELKTVEGVEEAYFSYGVYDLITKIKADTMDKLKEMVTRNIRTLTKVRSTLTLIMMEE
jgi:DNA-binding Lrp family transcriptional regulator